MRTYKEIIEELTQLFGELDELNQTLDSRLNKSIDIYKQLTAELNALKRQRDENINTLMELKAENTELKKQLNERK